jgi:hypothetical protein
MASATGKTCLRVKPTWFQENFFEGFQEGSQKETREVGGPRPSFFEGFVEIVKRCSTLSDDSSFFSLCQDMCLLQQPLVLIAMTTF